MQDIDVCRPAAAGRSECRDHQAARGGSEDLLRLPGGGEWRLAWVNPVHFRRHAGKQPQRLPRDLPDDTVGQVWGVLRSRRAIGPGSP